MSTQNEKLERLKAKLKERIELNTWPDDNKLSTFCYKIMIDTYQDAINLIDEEIKKDPK